MRHARFLRPDRAVRHNAVRHNVVRHNSVRHNSVLHNAVRQILYVIML